MDVVRSLWCVCVCVCIYTYIIIIIINYNKLLPIYFDQQKKGVKHQ